MSTRNDGGPASPIERFAPYAPGMPLRDWFAGQALPALISAGYGADTAAKLAGEYADAMLEARK